MRAAEAIRAYAVHKEYEVFAKHVDVMNFVTAGFRKLYTDFYIKLVNKAPAMWSYLYQLTNGAQADSTLQKLRRGLERLNTKPLLREIAAFQANGLFAHTSCRLKSIGLYSRPDYRTGIFLVALLFWLSYRTHAYRKNRRLCRVTHCDITLCVYPISSPTIHFCKNCFANLRLWP